MAGPFPKSLYATTNDYSAIQSMVAVTPADGTDLSGGVTRAVWINGAGNLQCDTANGETVVLTIPATSTGQVLDLAVKRIRATSTTATGIFACY